MIGPRVALRAREQIRQECKKPSTTSVQDRVEHRSLLAQDISVVGVFASLSKVLKKLSRNLGPQLFCVRNSFFLSKVSIMLPRFFTYTKLLMLEESFQEDIWRMEVKLHTFFTTSLDVCY